MLRAWLAWWTLCAALWLALVDRVPLSELVAGAAVAAIAATAALLVRRRQPSRPRLPAGAIPLALRQAAGLVGDLPALMRVLWRRGVLRRRERGAIVERPFAAVAPRAPERAGERVMAQALGSLAPATVVIDVDVERRVVVEHRLEGP